MNVPADAAFHVLVAWKTAAGSRQNRAIIEFRPENVDPAEIKAARLLEPVLLLFQYAERPWGARTK
jgi:hypothetical protein